MTYSETLEWMFAQLPMYQQKGKVAFNAKLDNIRAFSHHLDHPEQKFKSIHVAGTNGKGSCSHMLASILQEAGYKVGLYTSPHLKDFRERIRINGRKISKDGVVDFIFGNRPYLEEHQLSFFEMTVGMAFAYFAKEKVDIAVVEVGLGGRLDSTNIIVPEVSLITNIGMDHMDLLGDTLEQIAREKAGIIKSGIPVIISETQEGIAPIFKALARELKSKIIFADQEIKEDYKTSLLGNYQSKNVRGVVAVFKALESVRVEDGHIRKGLLKITKNTGLLGRWQVIRKKPVVVCDTAHNAEGLKMVLSQIEQEDFDALHMVLGFVKEKNLDMLLPLFPKNANYYFAKPNVTRGLDVLQLKDKALNFGLNGESYISVSSALEDALAKAKHTDFIFVGGSTFTVAEVI